jgi:hypothetical protein
MAIILRQAPFYDEFTTVEVQGHRHRVFPLQILVWVSLGPMGLRDLDPRMPRFPAVLDTGFSETFLIHEQQLRGWAGLRPEHLRSRNQVFRAHGRQIPVHAANLWLHPNQRGERDLLASAAPFFLEVHRGIGICGGSDLFPRLPLLGARALRPAKLQVFLDYQKCRASVRTPRKFWPFH